MGVARVRGPSGPGVHVLLGAVMAFLVACDAIGGGQDPASCPPLEAPAQREDGAQALLDLLEDQAAFVQAELPGWQLRHIYLAQPGEPISFLYAPTPTKGTPTTYVSQGEDGEWLVGQDERARLEEELPALDLTDLRLAPESVVGTVEEAVEGLRVLGVGLRREDCDLTWFVGGFVLDASGQPEEVVEGVVRDAEGDFEETDRYEVPGSP